MLMSLLHAILEGIQLFLGLVQTAWVVGLILRQYPGYS